ncbi:MAG: hypothetical protein ACOCQG_02505 [Candidatus Nanoarchaeia archaeon]
MLFTAAIAFVFPFISSFFVFLGLFILRVKAKFLTTFRVVTYAGVVTIFYNLIAYIMDFFFYFAYPELLSTPETIFQGDFTQMLALYGVILLLSFIHVLILEVIGLVNEYKIGKLRAFFAVVIIPLLIFLLISFALIIFFLILFLIFQSADASSVSGMLSSFQ